MLDKQVHAPLQPISATLHGRHVLLVEDNAFNRQVAAETLGDVGIIVEQASNGQEAVDKVLARMPDIVLMDIQMPVMDGLEATHQIHKLPGMEKLPIIAMTAHGMPQMRQQGMAAGFKDYLIKPIQPDDLYAALARCLLPGAKQPAQPGIADTLTNTIHHLPSIDAALALQMAGGQTSRVSTRLCQFIADMGDGGKQMQVLGQRQEWTKAWQLAHALKGAAGNIGASRLQALADAYLKEESAPARTALAQDISSELALLRQRAQTFHAHHANSKPEAVQATSVPAQILADIAQRIERHGHIPQEWLDTLVVSFDEPAKQTSLAQLHAALSRFDYAEAATHLARLTPRELS